MTEGEKPFDLKVELGTMDKGQLLSFRDFLDARFPSGRPVAQSVVPAPAASGAEPTPGAGILLRQSPPAPANIDQLRAQQREEPTGGLWGSVKKVLSGRQEQQPARPKGFVETIDDILASAQEREQRVPVTPGSLARYIQTIPLPQGAGLQNLTIEILDRQSARAQGEISKWGESRFIVMLGADREGGELQVRSHDLTSVVGRHKAHVGEINEALGNIISTLKKQLDEQIADKRWHTAGFAILEEEGGKRNLAISFQREPTAKEQAVGEARANLEKHINFRKRVANQTEKISLREALSVSGQLQGKEEETIEAMIRRGLREDVELIISGQLAPDEELVHKIREIYPEEEVREIEKLIGERLDQAGDEPWVSAWRGYLQPAPAVPTADPTEPPAGVPAPEPPTASQAGEAARELPAGIVRINEILRGASGIEASVDIHNSELREYLKSLHLPGNLEILDADTFWFEATGVYRIGLSLHHRIEVVDGHVYRALYFLESSRSSYPRIIEDGVEGAVSQSARELEDYMRNLPVEIAQNLQPQLEQGWEMTGMRVDDNGQLYFDFRKIETPAKPAPVAGAGEADAAAGQTEPVPPAVDQTGEPVPAQEIGQPETKQRFIELCNRWKGEIGRLHLQRPTLVELISALNKSNDLQFTDSGVEQFSDSARRQVADLIFADKISPGDPILQELFGLLAEEETGAITALIEEKLDQTRDWISSWRVYLHPAGAAPADAEGKVPLADQLQAATQEIEALKIQRTELEKELDYKQKWVILHSEQSRGWEDRAFKMNAEVKLLRSLLAQAEAQAADRSTAQEPRRQTKTPFEVLEVQEDASREDIIKAYRELQMAFHPDAVGAILARQNIDLYSNQGKGFIRIANQRAAEINVAYATLKTQGKV